MTVNVLGIKVWGQTFSKEGKFVAYDKYFFCIIVYHFIT